MQTVRNPTGMSRSPKSPRNWTGAFLRAAGGSGEVESREVDDALRAELDSLTKSFLEIRTKDLPRDGERRSAPVSKHQKD